MTKEQKNITELTEEELNNLSAQLSQQNQAVMQEVQRRQENLSPEERLDKKINEQNEAINTNFDYVFETLNTLNTSVTLMTQRMDEMAAVNPNPDADIASLGCRVESMEQRMDGLCKIVDELGEDK